MPDADARWDQWKHGTSQRDQDRYVERIWRLHMLREKGLIAFVRFDAFHYRISRGTRVVDYWPTSLHFSPVNCARGARAGRGWIKMMTTLGLAKDAYKDAVT